MTFSASRPPHPEDRDKYCYKCMTRHCVITKYETEHYIVHWIPPEKYYKIYSKKIVY